MILTKIYLSHLYPTNHLLNLCDEVKSDIDFINKLNLEDIVWIYSHTDLISNADKKLYMLHNANRCSYIINNKLSHLLKYKYQYISGDASIYIEISKLKNTLLKLITNFGINSKLPEYYTCLVIRRAIDNYSIKNIPHVCEESILYTIKAISLYDNDYQIINIVKNELNKILINRLNQLNSSN